MKFTSKSIIAFVALLVPRVATTNEKTKDWIEAHRVTKFAFTEEEEEDGNTRKKAEEPLML
jgi:hypothetical protein